MVWGDDFGADSAWSGQTPILHTPHGLGRPRSCTLRMVWADLDPAHCPHSVCWQTGTVSRAQRLDATSASSRSSPPTPPLLPRPSPPTPVSPRAASSPSRPPRLRQVAARLKNGGMTCNVLNEDDFRYALLNASRYTTPAPLSFFSPAPATHSVLALFSVSLRPAPPCVRQNKIAATSEGREQRSAQREQGAQPLRACLLHETPGGGARASMMEKLMWISAFMLLGVHHGGITVGEVERLHRSDFDKALPSPQPLPRPRPSTLHPWSSLLAHRLRRGGRSDAWRG